ncbi:hypothetical protein [Actinomadura oligospora]|uniref:hypothetical protein n=1 Tax=Actinomadura oligospora TaxID=111804 RepID=UPI00047B467E|nr:hypothetical protein [Actinomadura oligospora]
MSDEELDSIEEGAEAATPGTWYIRQLDDVNAMCLVAVSTVPDTGRGERWPAFDHGQIVAATLVQEPRYVDAADDLWDQNAQFIADARRDVPRLLAEVRRLGRLLETVSDERSSNTGSL